MVPAFEEASSDESCGDASWARRRVSRASLASTQGKATEGSVEEGVEQSEEELEAEALRACSARPCSFCPRRSFASTQENSGLALADEEEDEDPEAYVEELVWRSIRWIADLDRTAVRSRTDVRRRDVVRSDARDIVRELLGVLRSDKQRDDGGSGPVRSRTS